MITREEMLALVDAAKRADSDLLRSVFDYLTGDQVSRSVMIANGAASTAAWQALRAGVERVSVGSLLEEVAKLQGAVQRANARARVSRQHAARCDAEVAESEARAKSLDARLASIEAVHARNQSDWLIERDALIAKLEAATEGKATT